MTEDKIQLTLGKLHSIQSKRRVFTCRFVKAGRIRAAGNRQSNIEILSSAIITAQANGKFNNVAVFVDHPGWFEHPSLRNLAGVTFDTSWNITEESVEGKIRFYSEAQPIVNLLDEILEDGDFAPDIGLSMVCWPQWKRSDDDEDILQMTSINHIESIDLVFQPAADGRVLEALSTYNQIEKRSKVQCKECGAVIPNDGLCWYCENKPKLRTGGSEMTDEKITTQSDTPTPPPNPVDQAEEWMGALSASVAASVINGSGLPQASKSRLAQRTYASPAEVNEAIEKERAYLAELTEDQVIEIGGQAPRGGHIQVGLDAIEKITIAAEALLSGERPEKGVAPLSGIRELYMLLSGDYELTGLFNPDRVQLANVNSSTMAGLVANALNKRVVNLFQEYPQWWAPILNIEDFATLQEVKWITLGGVGELPTVAEGAAYTELTWDDQTEVATFIKKGGYLGITLETIDKDDTRRVQSAPRALAQAAWLTLSKAISSIFTLASGVGPDMSDGDALFHTNHSNLGTTGLSLTEYGVVRTAMRKQTEVNSDERLGALTAPKYILVPPDLEITALQVLASQHQYTYALANAPAAPENVFAEGDELNARMQSARDRVIVIDLWTDTNNWAAAADPRLYPTIGLGFRYGRVPEVFSVASPTAGLMFTNDTMPVKVRFFFATGPMDYRGLYKENVA